MNLIAELADASAEILEPNLQFLRTDSSDKNRYFVGAEALQALGWVATGIALPILLTGANEVVKLKVKEWLEKRKIQSADASEATKTVDQEISQALLEAKKDLRIDDCPKAEAVAAVSEFLSNRGWPKMLATADASDIVEAIAKKIHGRL